VNLELLVAGKLIEWAQRVADRVNTVWPSQQSSVITGNKEIHVGELQVTAQAIMVEIVASGQAAWEIEMGRGSLMEVDASKNPYIIEYLGRADVNPWRFHSSRLPIMGRSAGDYTDLDGVTHVSSGHMQGLDLERDGKPEFQPAMPMHTIKTTLEFMWPTIVADINEAVNTAVGQEIVTALTMDIYV
jgi:hypothetical protein